MNNRLQNIFGTPKVFLPVIHPFSESSALGSIKVAVESGADGIFLINQGMTSEEVLRFVPKVHEKYPNLWIGVNLLDTPAHLVIKRISGLPVGGVWSDNAGIDERSEDQFTASLFSEEVRAHQWKGLHFGGVAFKYQRPVPDLMLPVAALKALPFVDVITTSGPGTGLAADLGKVVALKSGAPLHPMALASGVSPENIKEYLPHVDVFLVASGIETSKYSGILVPERTKLLADRIHGL